MTTAALSIGTRSAAAQETNEGGESSFARHIRLSTGDSHTSAEVRQVFLQEELMGSAMMTAAYLTPGLGNIMAAVDGTMEIGRSFFSGEFNQALFGVLQIGCAFIPGGGALAGAFRMVRGVGHALASLARSESSVSILAA